MPVVKVSDEEAELYPIPGKEDAFYKFRLAEELSEKFHKTDFIKAIEKVGLTKTGE